MMGRVGWEALGKDDLSEICLIWLEPPGLRNASLNMQCPVPFGD